MKRTNLKARLGVLVLISLCFSLFTINATQAIVQEEKTPKDEEKVKQDVTYQGMPGQLQKDEPKPEYAPGELIVKLKEGKTFEDIKELNEKYKVSASEKVFKDTTGPKEVLKALKERLAKLNPEHQSWYWQLDKESKEYKDYIAKIEKEKEELQGQIKAQEELIAHLEQRQKRAPEGVVEQAQALEEGFQRTYTLNVDPATDIPQAAEEYKNDPNVEYAEPNYIYHTQAFPETLPNDTYINPSGDGLTWSSGAWGQAYEDMWGLKKIQADRAWAISQGEGVIVAVIDTGIDYNHEDIAENIWINQGEIAGNGIDDDGNGHVDDIKGYDFAYYDNDPQDGYGHGTHVAGTIAAVGNNAKGIIGVAPRAKVMAVKGLSDGGGGNSTDLANCLRYAADNGADILSNSWGGEGSSQVIEDAVNYAYAKGCVLVASAGNSDSDVSESFPANLTNVITVAATNQNDQKCDFSNYGEKIDVAAPGGGTNNPPPSYEPKRNILSLRANGTGNSGLVVGDKYYRQAGTSMACPHVSGLAALIMSRNHSNDMVRLIIQNSADDIGAPGKDIYFGYGRVNVYKAVSISNGDMGLTYPENNTFVRGIVDIVGSASIDKFQRYELYYSPVANPQDTTLLSSSTTPVKNGLLGRWNTIGCQETKYFLSLKVLMNDGASFIYRTYVTIDNINEPPTFRDISNKGAVVGRLLEFKVEADDPDDPATDSGILDYSVNNLPPGAHFDPTTQIFSWQPAASEKGIYEVIFSVRDKKYAINHKPLIISTAYIEEIITNDIFRTPSYPRVYKNKIVWEDVTHNIYMYDLSTGQKSQITTNSRARAPDIYEDKIIWHEIRGIYMYDLSTGQKTQIAIGAKVGLWGDPDIYKNKIVWGDSRKGLSVGSEIYMYDLSTGQEIPICTNTPYDQQNPKIYGDRIVWNESAFDFDGYEWSHTIFMYDLSTGQKSQITSEAIKPAIYEDKIVWVPYPSFDGVYVYDISSGKISKLPTRIGVLMYHYPAIYEDTIAFPGSPIEKQIDIYMYDIHADLETQITFDPDNNEFRTDIYQNSVVWVDDRNMLERDQYNINIARIFFAPWLIRIEPLIICPGDFITLTGNLFGYSQDQSYIEFTNGIKGEVMNWSNTSITCRVPQNAQTGLVKVVTPGGTSNGIKIAINRNPPKLNLPYLSSGVNEGELLEFIVTATDEDGGTITFTHPTAEELARIVPGASFTMTRNEPGLIEGLFSWTPNYTQARTDAYAVPFQVSDGALASELSSVSITVNNVNRPPTIYAGNQEVDEGKALYFDAFARDPDMDELSFSATGLPEGAIFPDGVILPTPGIDEETIGIFHWKPTYTQAGVYKITLTVTDPGGLSASVNVKITVRDKTPPQTVISTIPSGWSAQPVSITLTATDSSSGVKDTFYSTNGSEPSIKYTGPFTLSDGIYTIKYYSVDNAGNKEAIQVAPELKIDTTAPTKPKVTGSGIWRPQASELTASWLSSDTVSGIAEYQYKINEGSPSGKLIKGWTSTGVNASVKVTSLRLQPPKAYYFSVKAKNQAGIWSSIGNSAGIKLNRAPTAIIVAQPHAGHSPLKVKFFGNRSFDLDGRIVSYSWDFGDGTTSVQVNPAHTYFNASSRWPRAYRVSLAVTDDRGAASTARATIIVFATRRR